MFCRLNALAVLWGGGLFVIVAIAVGFCCSLPFLLNRRIARRIRQKGKNPSLGILLAMVMISFLVMSLAIGFCKIMSPDNILPFSIAQIATFVGCIVIYAAKELIG